jgi:hypothetical protein
MKDKVKNTLSNENYFMACIFCGRNILIRNILILLLVFFISFILGMSFCYHFKLVDLDKIGWGVFISTRF